MEVTQADNPRRRPALIPPRRPAPSAPDVGLDGGAVDAMLPRRRAQRVLTQQGLLGRGFFDLVDVGFGEQTNKVLAVQWGFQPLNHNKQKCEMFANNNHVEWHTQPFHMEPDRDPVPLKENGPNQRGSTR